MKLENLNYWTIVQYSGKIHDIFYPIGIYTSEDQAIRARQDLERIKGLSYKILKMKVTKE